MNTFEHVAHACRPSTWWAEGGKLPQTQEQTCNIIISKIA